mgnify:CR=1 FL=1
MINIKAIIYSTIVGIIGFYLIVEIIKILW